MTPYITGRGPPCRTLEKLKSVIAEEPLLRNDGYSISKINL